MGHDSTMDDLVLRLRAGVEAKVHSQTPWFRALLRDLVGEGHRCVDQLLHPLDAGHFENHRWDDGSEAEPIVDRSACLLMAWQAMVTRIESWLRYTEPSRGPDVCPSDDLGLTVVELERWSKTLAVHHSQLSGNPPRA